MTRLLGSRERGAHPELQLGLRLETPGEQPPQESLTQRQHNRWDKFSCPAYQWNQFSPTQSFHNTLIVHRFPAPRVYKERFLGSGGDLVKADDALEHLFQLSCP
jgi:hypothetical protein